MKVALLSYTNNLQLFTIMAFNYKKNTNTENCIACTQHIKTIKTMKLHVHATRYFNLGNKWCRLTNFQLYYKKELIYIVIK